MEHSVQRILPMPIASVIRGHIMKKNSYILILIILLTGCDSKKPDNRNYVLYKGQMRRAYHEFGCDEKVPQIKNLKHTFVIIVDTSLKARNFVSYDETYERDQSVELDTFSLSSMTENWEKLSIKQKIKRLHDVKKQSAIRADSIHRINNQGQQQVWIINNSNDTVIIPMQDWLYICVLQAKAKNGKWYPVEYWRFSHCGNSYYDKNLFPKTANSFIMTLPKNGNFKTRLRYKLLGKKKYYFSNEFDGKINEYSFIENPKDYDSIRGEAKPHFKLEKFINREKKHNTKLK